jgi:hypothetical protein
VTFSEQPQFSMTDNLPLRRTVITDFHIESPPTLGVSDKDAILYLSTDGSLALFDSQSHTQFKLPPPDPSLQNPILSIALSPSHTFAFAGFANGGIQLWDLSNPEAVAALSEAKPVSIIQACFLSDSQVLIFDEERHLSSVAIIPSSPGFSFEISDVTSFETVASRLIPLSGSTFVGIALTDRFIVADVNPTFRIILDEAATEPSAAWEFLGPNSLLAIASSTNIQVYQFGEGDPVLLCQTAIDKAATFVGFLSSNIIAIVPAEFSIILFDVSSKEIKTIRLSVKGILVSSSHTIRVLSNDSLTLLSLSKVFSEELEKFKVANNVNAGISLCKQAISNFTEGLIGLPVNPIERRLEVEENLHSFLEFVTREQLKHGEEPRKLAKYLFDIAKEFSIEDWFVKEVFGIFNELNVTSEFVAQIIEQDPEARLLPYTPVFVGIVIGNCKGLDASEFLFNLPSKIIPPSILLKYAQMVGNPVMVNKIYTERLNGTFNALQHYFLKEEFIQAFTILKKNLTGRTISWLFATTEGKFPRLAKLIAFDSNLALEIVKQIEASAKRPLSLQGLINGILISLGDDFALNSPLFRYIENLIVTSSTPLNFSEQAVRVLLKSIFTKEIRLPDNRETILLILYKLPSTPPTFKRGILPLCQTFGFLTTLRTIIIELKLTQEILTEIITTKTSDPFIWIENYLNDETIDDIKVVVIEHPDDFATYNFERFIRLVDSTFPDLVFSIVNGFKDQDVKSYYITKRLLEKKPEFGSHLKEAAPFIVQYYPDQLLDFIKENPGEDLSEHRELFEKNELIECAVIVSGKIEDQEKLALFAKKLIVRLNVLNANLVQNLITSIFEQVSDNREKIFHKLTKCYLVPLSDSAANLDLIGSSVFHLIESVSSFLGYHKVVVYCVRVFQRLGQTQYETIMKKVLRNRSLSETAATELISSFSQVLKHGEADFNALVCAFCKQKLFVARTSVKILDCGHAIHDTRECAGTPDCPLCVSTP